MLRTIFLVAVLAPVAFGADLIVINANVITVDTSKPYAEAFAVENGRFHGGRHQRRNPPPGDRPGPESSTEGHDGHARIQRRPSAPARRVPRRIALFDAVARAGQGPHHGRA